jgi:ubiquitin C-terminal hydrolase
MQGLNNLGATCSINSLLQVLYRNDKIKSVILNSETSEGTITYELKDLFKVLESSNSSIHPGRFIHNFYEIFKNNFRKFEQNDICELYLFIIQKIHDEICIDNNNINKSYCNIFEEHNYKIAIHNNLKYSNIYKLFQGSHMHTIQCLTCFHTTNTFEPFIMLSLDIVPNSSISELLDNYYTTETRIKDDWVCEKCKMKCNYNKTINIMKYPEILFISLNRFKDMTTKNIELVDINTQINLKKNYNLQSIGFHHGILNAGHYNAICKNTNNNFILYDDNNVAAINNLEPLLKTSNSYLLCYE